MTVAPAAPEAVDGSSSPTHLKQFIGAVALLAATIAELGVAVSLVIDPTELGDALLVHAASVGGLLLAIVLNQRRARAIARGELFFVIATAFLGPLGACGALLTMGYLRWFAPRATPFSEWYAALFDSAEFNSAQGLQRRLLRDSNSVQERSSVAPFADMMASGSVEQKQAVVALIAGRFRPEYAQTLLAAMNDAEPTVRVMAATAAARIEGRFLESSMALENVRNREPGNVKRSFELARHYDAYANTGLLDAGRVLAARTRALELYRHCDRAQRGDIEVSNAIIRLLVRLGCEGEAIKRFAPLVANGTAAAESFIWYVECLYRMRRYETLRKACRRFQLRNIDSSQLSERCRQVVQFWADGGHAP